MLKQLFYPWEHVRKNFALAMKHCLFFVNFTFVWSSERYSVQVSRELNEEFVAEKTMSMTCKIREKCWKH